MSSQSKVVSPLRQRIIEDMRMRKLAPQTQTAYIRAVRKFARYLNRAPDTATAEDLRNFQLHLPHGFHRIRHYGLLGNARRALELATARTLLHAEPPAPREGHRSCTADHNSVAPHPFVCRHCGAPMILVCALPPQPHIRAPPAPCSP